MTQHRRHILGHQTLWNPPIVPTAGRWWLHLLLRRFPFCWRQRDADSQPYRAPDDCKRVLKVVLRRCPAGDDARKSVVLSFAIEIRPLLCTGEKVSCHSRKQVVLDWDKFPCGIYGAQFCMHRYCIAFTLNGWHTIGNTDEILNNWNILAQKRSLAEE